jgi:HEAT repeat protein
MRRDVGSAPTLLRALDEEQDLDVQRAILGALGKIGTQDAVQRLVDTVKAEARLFRRPTGAVRLSAVRALAEVRTPAAMATLQGVVQDRDNEIREAARQGLESRAGDSGAGETPTSDTWTTG